MAKHRPTTGVKPSNKKRKAAATTGGAGASKRSKPSSSSMNAKDDLGKNSKSASLGPGAANKKPKRAKLRDQPYIPVPGSEFKSGGAGAKGKKPSRGGDEEEDDDMDASMDSEEEGEEDDEEDDDDDDVLAAMGENEEEAGLEYLTGAGASTGFLTGLDVKALSRSKKETDRLHTIEKNKESFPKQKRKKEPSLASSFDSDEDDDDDLDDLLSDFDSGSEVGADEDEERWDDQDELEAGYTESDDDEEEAELATSDDDEQPSKPRKRQRDADVDVEGNYEARRTAMEEHAAAERLKAGAGDEQLEVGRLPIKLPNGELQMVPGRTRIPVPVDHKAQARAAAIAAQKKPEGDDNDESDESDDDDEQGRVEKMAQTKGRFGRLAIVDVLTLDLGNLRGKAKTQQRLTIAKEQIAQIGAEIMSGGELIDMLPLLTRLSTYALEKVKSPNTGEPPIPIPTSIRGLALLSMLAVYKDLIPGYRIRELTALEQAEKVRDEVRRLREGEKGLVNSYKVYLKTMEGEIKKRTPLASIALRCMSDLLVAAPHFNFAENIMGIVVGRLSRRSWDEDAEMCLQAIITVFRQDVAANHSFTLLRLIARMIKERHFKVHPNVMACLLHLRLRSELSMDEDDRKKGKGKGRGGKYGRGGKDSKEREQPKIKSEVRKQWMTKNRRKAEKERKEVEKELEIAEAEVDVEERKTVQTETLKNLFVLYFSILKQPRRGPLLPAAMEGIAKFAHLVNIEFFRDLLAVLRKFVVQSEEEEEDDEEEEVTIATGAGASVRLRMLAIVTAFELLSGQGEALNIDLNDFIVQLYVLLLRLSLDTGIEEQPRMRNNRQLAKGPATNKQGQIKLKDVQLATTSDLLFRCLHLVFFSRHASTANSPPWRAAAFAKRLLECAVQFPAATALRAIRFVGQLIAKEPKLEALLSTEDRTADGIYRPDLDDPQLCNPFATNFWELGMLEMEHEDGQVRQAAHEVANLKTSNSHAT